MKGGTTLNFTDENAFAVNTGTQFLGYNDTYGVVRLHSDMGAEKLTVNVNVTIPNLTISGGELTGPGTVTVHIAGGNGLFRWIGGKMSGTGETIVTNISTMTLEGGTKSLIGRKLTNNGEATWQVGEIQLSNGAQIVNDGALATFDIRTDSTIRDLGGPGGSRFINRNFAIFSKSAGGGTTTIEPFFDNETGGEIRLMGRIVQFKKLLANSGTILLQGGQLLADAGYTQTDGSTVTAGGTLTVGTTLDLNGGTLQFNGGQISTASGLFIAAGASLFGYGAITGDVTNAGTLTVGLPSSYPNSTITVAGNFTQTSAGRLVMDVGSGTSDRLQISGLATLAGTLDVDLAGGYPGTGSSFALVSYGSRSGTFVLDLPSLPLGTWDSRYDDPQHPNAFSLWVV